MLCILLAYEVMDKEWPLGFVLVGFFGVAVLAFFVCRRWPFAVAVFLPVLILGSLRHGMELLDPYVGPEIRAEAGTSYVVLSCIAILSSFVLLGVGAFEGWKRRKSRRINS